MKFIAIVLFSICTFISNAQVFELSFQTAVKNPHDTIRLNLPFIYGYYPENDRLIPSGRNGQRSISIPCTYPVFGELLLKNHSFPVVLIPGKTLRVQLDDKGSLIGMTGTAAAANRLFQQLKLDSIAFFDRPDSTGNNTYASLPVDSIETKVVIPLMKERNTRLSMIARSNLTEDLKRLLHSEVVYHALNQLNYYSRGIARMKRDELIRFYIQTMDSLPPTRFVGHPGPQFHRYTENYIGLLEAKAFLYYQQHKLSGKDALPFYHISLDSGNTLVDVKGKLFMNWLAARNNLDTTTATEYLAQNLQSLFFFRDLKQFRSLYQDFVSYQPRSNYMHQLKQYLSRLERSLLLGSNDSSIVVWKNYDSLSSVRDLLTSFRGKVVYLDIWGTWCGPCKQELKHLPELKKRFAGKEVVFIYLDMDDDIKDKDWREFILVNRMSGVHVRKNKTTILPFWEELLPNDKEKRGLYPTYFIFDKQGQLAVPRAARPSDRERLYQQIESLL